MITQPGKAHAYRMPDAPLWESDEDPEPLACRKAIEPWLSALFQSEHLTLLLGNGFTTGVACACGATPVAMSSVSFEAKHAKKVDAAAKESAERTGRGAPNLEDQLRAANELVAGLAILGEATLVKEWKSEIDRSLRALIDGVLAAERGMRTALDSVVATALTAKRRASALPPAPPRADVLTPFLLSFASRSASRDRLAIFTTNYDRVVELGCELAGIRLLDRFVGSLAPIFRSSRLEVDFHYNPPGVRGEPRLLEGVVRFTKLHGSIDWRFEGRSVRREAVPLGAQPGHPALPQDPSEHLVVYPNSTKDLETSAFPYSELFRDFSAAVCRPNSVLFVYGYGFGDSHINDAIRDMLTVPSTHLVIASFDDASGRVPRFIDGCGHEAQVSFLLGHHFGEIGNLVRYYLPKPAIDAITARRAELLRKRQPPLPESLATPDEPDEDESE